MKTELKSNYDKVPITKAVADNMSWNPYDQLFLKRIFDLQDNVTERFISDTYDRHALIIIDTVKEMLNENKQLFLDSFNSIKKDITDIKNDLKSLHQIAIENKGNIKDLKSDVRKINVEIENVKNRIAEHEFRLAHIEKFLKL